MRKSKLRGFLAEGTESLSALSIKNKFNMFMKQKGKMGVSGILRSNGIVSVLW